MWVELMGKHLEKLMALLTVESLKLQMGGLLVWAKALG